MFVLAIYLILRGYPVAYSLGGTAIVFFIIGVIGGLLSPSMVELIPTRIFDLMSNSILLAIPYFLFMGKILEKTHIAEKMLISVSNIFSRVQGGLGIAVVVVGGIFAASTSVVAASVVTMGAISLPAMLSKGYNKEYAVGVIAASGTLGQIIPPSIVLIFLADQVGIPVGDLFGGAIVPGFILCLLYVLYTISFGLFSKSGLPKPSEKLKVVSLVDTFKYIVPLLILGVSVLGSIFWGIATPTEAGAIGCTMALIISKIFGNPSIKMIGNAAKESIESTSSIMLILISSAVFALVFKYLEGDLFIRSFLSSIPGGDLGFVLTVSLMFFVLGFFLDFFEITFILIPIVLPIAHQLGIDLVWLSVLLSLNIQASFLTPPFGFSLFFLKSVVPKEIGIKTLYTGVIPFVIIQIITIVLVYNFPKLVNWAY
mgnify:CR=1 FL=1